MKTFYCTKKIKYDGSNLQSLYAYKTFGIQGDSIVAFAGPCEVSEHLVDLEDKLNGDFIKAEAMLHFIVEHFEITLTETIFRQRLLVAIIKEYLGNKIIRHGDDLFVGKGKLSVSISTSSPVSTLIHIGLNINNKKTPVKTASLEDLGVDYNQAAKDIMELYRQECEDIYLARRKVRGVC